MYNRVAALALGLALLGLSSEFGFAQTSEPKEKAPNEADVILQELQKERS